MAEPARWGTLLRRICGSGGTVMERDSQLERDWTKTVMNSMTG